MGLFKKKNGHKNLFGKIIGKAPKVLGTAVSLGSTLIPGLGGVGGKLGSAIGKIGSKVSSISGKVSAATGGQIDLQKMLPQRAESGEAYLARFSKGLGGAASGMTQQMATQADPSASFSENLEAGFTANRLPSWLLYLVAAVGVGFVGYKLINK